MCIYMDRESFKRMQWPNGDGYIFRIFHILKTVKALLSEMQLQNLHIGKIFFFPLLCSFSLKKKTSTHVAVVPKKRSALNTHFKRYYAKKIGFPFPFHDALDPLCPFAEGEKE